MNIIGRFARNLRDSLADAGEKFLDIKMIKGLPDQKLVDLCRDLVSHKGVASGTALAREVVSRYQSLDKQEKLKFFLALEKNFGPDFKSIKVAAGEFVNKQDNASLVKLSASLKTDRQKLFDRMNMAPEGTMALVSLREDLLDLIDEQPRLKIVDDDLKALLISWFNPGFLVLTKIDWDTEASILEKIIEYETVHNIGNWHDLKQRLVAGRKCFAFFHPALEDEPLIFVEVALTKGIARSIQAIISETDGDISEADTAIFYSINNCQKGLRQIPLGNFLIKQVVTELERELPAIRNFSTLSPVPGFAEWLKTECGNPESNYFSVEEKAQFAPVSQPDWHMDPAKLKDLEKPLMKACAVYLVKAKRKGKPLNPVARFHFGNGARLHRINWMGNSSLHGMEESFGLMVNYLYDPRDIESNHEDYVTSGELALSKQVRNLI